MDTLSNGRIGVAIDLERKPWLTGLLIAANGSHGLEWPRDTRKPLLVKRSCGKTVSVVRRCDMDSDPLS